jgi:hypothetical protein
MGLLMAADAGTGVIACHQFGNTVGLGLRSKGGVAANTDRSGKRKGYPRQQHNSCQ